MKHVLWILIGALCGLALGKLIFPQPETEPADENRVATPASLLSATSGHAAQLSLPTVEAISSSQAETYWERPAVPGTREERAFYLGLLNLGEASPDWSAVASFINGAPSTANIKEYARNVFASLAERDPDAAFELTKNLTDRSVRHSVMRKVAEVWAGIDPEGAWSMIQSLDSESGQGRLLDEVVHEMAKRDPRAILAKLDEMPSPDFHHYEVVVDTWMGRDRDHRGGIAWIQSLEDHFMKGRLLTQAIRTLATHSPADAFALSMSSGHEGQGRHPAQEMLLELAAYSQPGSPETAMEFVHQLPDELLTDHFMRLFASHAALNSPDKAIELATELENDGHHFQSYMEGLISQIASTNPVKATELVRRLPEGKPLSSAYESIMRSWMKSDEFSAAQWLADLAPTPSKDEAISAFTRELVSIDPERALQWASSINDPTQREKQMGKLVDQWRKTDAPAVDAWKAARGAE
ncbi:MAG: hypothetical protein AAF514_13485 [Verrucomicrobiota bacterium]